MMCLEILTIPDLLEAFYNLTVVILIIAVRPAERLWFEPIWEYGLVGTISVRLGGTSAVMLELGSIEVEPEENSKEAVAFHFWKLSQFTRQEGIHATGAGILLSQASTLSNCLRCLGWKYIPDYFSAAQQSVEEVSTHVWLVNSRRFSHGSVTESSRSKVQADLVSGESPLSGLCVMPVSYYKGWVCSL